MGRKSLPHSPPAGSVRSNADIFALGLTQCFGNAFYFPFYLTFQQSIGENIELTTKHRYFAISIGKVGNFHESPKIKIDMCPAD